MVRGKKVIVVMPAYNASKTLEQTYREVPRDIVDTVILVDDQSSDDTVALAHRLGIDKVIQHPKNRGYGGNQKTCYKTALEEGADIVVMLHPDYQYTPKLIEALVYPIANGVYDVMLASRILGKSALKGGMPLYKYIANRILTFFQNLFLNQKLSEYHTGYRAFSREVLLDLPLEENSDDFIFDNEILAQVIYKNYRIGELSCPTRYFKEASSINFSRSVIYGLGILRVTLQFLLQKTGLFKFRIFDFQNGKKLLTDAK